MIPREHGYPGHRHFVVALRRLVGLAETTQIGSDYHVSLGKLGDGRPPHVAVLSVAVKQDNRFALAGDQIVGGLAMGSGAAAVSATTITPAVADSESNSEKRKACYQASSPEVQTFYRVNRYPTM
jgi:hypothetical protein